MLSVRRVLPSRWPKSTSTVFGTVKVHLITSMDDQNTTGGAFGGARWEASPPIVGRSDHPPRLPTWTLIVPYKWAAAIGRTRSAKKEFSQGLVVLIHIVLLVRAFSCEGIPHEPN